MPIKRTHKAIFVTPEGRKGGKMDRTGKYFWHGDILSEGANSVSYAVARHSNNKEKAVEKRFWRAFSHPEQDFKTLLELKKLGIKVVPNASLVLTKNDKGKLERSLVMKDLTERGKKQVYTSNVFHKNKKVVERIQKLRNFREMMGQQAREQVLALSKGYYLGQDSWMYVIDPKTNTGEVFVTDVDSVSPEKRFYHISHPRTFSELGIPTGEVRAAIKRMETIFRRGQHTERLAIGQLASEMPMHSKAVLENARKVIAKHQKQFKEIQRVYQFMVNIGTKSQIGGAMMENPPSGLTKIERKTVQDWIHKNRTHPFLKTIRETYGRDYYMEVVRMLRRIDIIPERKRPEKYSIRRKVRRSQENSVRIGQYVSHAMHDAAKRLRKPVFSYNAKKAKKFDSLKESLRGEKTNEGAEDLLAKSEDIIYAKLVEILKESFKNDLKTLAKTRTRVDLAPYARNP